MRLQKSEDSLGGGRRLELLAKLPKAVVDDNERADHVHDRHPHVADPARLRRLAGLAVRANGTHGGTPSVRCNARNCLEY